MYQEGTHAVVVPYDPRDVRGAGFECKEERKRGREQKKKETETEKYERDQARCAPCKLYNLYNRIYLN